MKKWLYKGISSDSNGLHVPEAVVQVVQVVHPDALVLAGDLVGGHGGAADGERQLPPVLVALWIPLDPCLDPSG